jgi:signal transduction histidine kinase
MAPQVAARRKGEGYPAPPASGPTVGRSDPDLEAAAARVAALWRADDNAGVATDEEVAAILTAVTRALRRACRGTPFTIDTRATSILGRRLLELLRGELVRGWTDRDPPVEPALILATLTGVERLREALEPNWSEYLASRLAGPDGLELLVEVAHDLRSPLTSILFLAETLQRGQSGTVNELQHRQLGLIYSAALGLSSLASDAIDLTRNGDGVLDEKPSPFSLATLFDSVREIVLPMAEEKGLTVRLVPEGPDYRLGNPLALGRVLLNLTTNALKFTNQGYVEIRAQPKRLTRLEFSVRDTGRGINANAQRHLYEPFRRNQWRSGYCFSGTGLGLAICRKLVAAMGSELQLETRAGWGTRFYFELKLPVPPQVAL